MVSMLIIFNVISVLALTILGLYCNNDWYKHCKKQNETWSKLCMEQNKEWNKYCKNLVQEIKDAASSRSR